MVNFSQLSQASTTGLRHGADRARRLAAVLDQCGSDTDRQRQALSRQWSGIDSAAAAGRLIGHAGDFRATARAYSLIERVVTDLAEQIEAAQRQLRSAIADAEAIPGRVDDDGIVHIDWTALGDDASATAAARHRALTVSARLRDALLAAGEADQRAQTELARITAPKPALSSLMDESGVAKVSRVVPSPTPERSAHAN